MVKSEKQQQRCRGAAKGGAQHYAAPTDGIQQHREDQDGDEGDAGGAPRKGASSALLGGRREGGCVWCASGG